MTVLKDESAPRPWYKTWWKFIPAVGFWPIFFTIEIARSNWQQKNKVAGILVLWFLALAAVSLFPAPMRPVDMKLQNPTPGEVEGTEVTAIPTINASPAPKLSPTPTDTPTPTITLPLKLTPTIHMELTPIPHI